MKPFAILCSMWAGCVVLAAAADPPVSAGRVLFEQLRRCDDAEGLTDRIRATRTGMEALLAADRDTLFGALDAVIADGRLYQESRILLVEQCARKDPDAAVARLEGIHEYEMYIEIGIAVWGTIARSDPDRAAAAVQQLYQPAGFFYRSTYDGPFYFHRLAGSIMCEVGGAWFRRDGLQAMGKLGTLPHAGDLDDPLFQGMCDAATKADQRLALLDWMTSPPGKRLSRFQKGVKWYETMLIESTREDPAKTRAWMEKHFPAGKSRQSDESSDWDITHFRLAFFRTWAETDARHAADWLTTQLPAGDRDADQFFSASFRILQSAPDGGLDVALAWLVRQKDKPAFVRAANEVLVSATYANSNSKDLETVTACFAKFPPAMRERILLYKMGEPFDSLFPSSLSSNKKVVGGLFPLEKDRQRLEEKVRKLMPAKKAADKAGDPGESITFPWADAFKLEDRKPGAAISADARTLAKRLAAQYHDCHASNDPQARLAGLACLEWLANAGNEDFANILPAHLRNTRDVMDGFAVELINAWTAHDWRACEKFAWNADLPDPDRDSVLTANFEQAARVSPDDVFARLNVLIDEGRLKRDALNDDMYPQTAGPGRIWFAFDIPKNLGAGWIANDGPRGVDKMKTLPAGWVSGAIEGAAGHYLTAEAGLELLEWIVRMDAADPKPKHKDPDEPRCTGLRWYRWLQASTALSRLTSIDLDAAIRWLEASPDRLAKSNESFDGFYHVADEFFKHDPPAAAAWAHRVRPNDENVTWWLVSAIAAKDEAQAIAWIDAHPDDPNLDSALTVMIRRWETTRPADAAKLIVRMSKTKRIEEAASLIHTWKLLDAAAAQRFLDETFAGSRKDRKAVEAEIARQEKCASDQRRP